MFQLLNATDNRRARDDTRRTSCKAVRDTLQVFCRRFCLVHVATMLLLLLLLLLLLQ